MNYDPDVQGYLESQYNLRNSHKEQLKAEYGTWKELFDLSRVFNSKPPSFKDIKKVDQRFDTSKPKTSVSNILKPKESERKENTVLLTKEEVDIYLLEHIFSVDITVI
tara:strand:- start:48 stop:371 length:324 start_codon:yes stop_codon:yes gene_type:complete